jgi:hypothetical protein
MSRAARGAEWCVGVGTIALSIGFITSAQPPISAGVVLLGGLWIAGLHRGWGRIAQLGMSVFVALIIASVLLESPLPLGLIALVCALAAWDLRRFSAWLTRWAPAAGADLERSHFTRLLVALGVGLALGVLCWLVQVPISFLGALALASIGVYGLYRFSTQWREVSGE